MHFFTNRRFNADLGQVFFGFHASEIFGYYVVTDITPDRHHNFVMNFGVRFCVKHSSEDTQPIFTILGTHLEQLL